MNYREKERDRQRGRSKITVDKDKLKLGTWNGIVFDSVLEMKYYRDVLLPLSGEW